MKKTVWITGASSGLGLHTARALIRNGYKVVAGARSFADAERHLEGCLCLPLDVTQEDSVASFTEQAYSAHGAPDVLVCCAGVLNLGACECYTTEEIRRVMDVNFLGMTRTLSRVLPLMRAKGSGRIVLFSSLNGLMGIPFEGAYTASKHAIEGYSECLQLECRHFGMEVMLVRPGDHQSGSSAYRAHSCGMQDGHPYQPDYEMTCRVIAHDESNGSDPALLGEAVTRALAKKRLPRHLCVASLDQKFAVWLHTLLPRRLFERILLSHYQKTTGGRPS